MGALKRLTGFLRTRLGAAVVGVAFFLLWTSLALAKGESLRAALVGGLVIGSVVGVLTFVERLAIGSRRP